MNPNKQRQGLKEDIPDDFENIFGHTLDKLGSLNMEESQFELENMINMFSSKLKLNKIFEIEEAKLRQAGKQGKKQLKTYLKDCISAVLPYKDKRIRIVLKYQKYIVKYFKYLVNQDTDIISVKSIIEFLKITQKKYSYQALLYLKNVQNLAVDPESSNELTQIAKSLKQHFEITKFQQDSLTKLLIEFIKQDEVIFLLYMLILNKLKIKIEQLQFIKFRELCTESITVRKVDTQKWRRIYINEKLQEFCQFVSYYYPIGEQQFIENQNNLEAFDNKLKQLLQHRIQAANDQLEIEYLSSITMTDLMYSMLPDDIYGYLQQEIRKLTCKDKIEGFKFINLKQFTKQQRIQFEKKAGRLIYQECLKQYNQSQNQQYNFQELTKIERKNDKLVNQQYKMNSQQESNQNLQNQK